MKLTLPKFLKKSLTIEDLHLPCEHDWKLVTKTYAPPRRDIKPDGLDKDLQEKLLFGVTNVLWECDKCSQIRKEEILGSDENQWLNLIDQVEQYGMQYVKEGDKVYAVAKVPPTTQQPTK